MQRSLALLSGMVMLVSGFAVSQSNVPPKVVSVPAFTVIGIECRTDNAKEASGHGCIGKQWGRLFGEGFVDKIPGKLDRSIIAVYTDYASDKDGEYTYILGAKVKDDTTAPADMVKVKVAAGKYAVFTSEKGAAQQVVPATWKRIWETPKSQPGGNRTYKTDFELYDQRATDPKNSEVDIYIGVR